MFGMNTWIWFDTSSWNLHWSNSTHCQYTFNTVDVDALATTEARASTDIWHWTNKPEYFIFSIRRDKTQFVITGVKRFILTHWGRVTHICVGELTIIGSDNGLSPERRQAIIWTNAGILLIGNKPQWNYKRNSNIFNKENTFENVVCEMLLISSRPQCVKKMIYFFLLNKKGYPVIVTIPVPLLFWRECGTGGVAMDTQPRRVDDHQDQQQDYFLLTASDGWRGHT